MKNKKFKILLLILILLPCAFLFSACNQKPYVVNIVKSDEYENSTIYTITYSDGSVSTFTVQNGKDGQDAADITIEDIYNAYKEKTGNSALTFDEFLKKYLSLTVEDTDEKQAVNRAMLSAVSIYTRATNSNNIYCGAGVIYKMNSDYSYIITNYHLVYNTDIISKLANEIHGYLYGYNPEFSSLGNRIIVGGSYLNLTYIGGSMQNDLAVLRCTTDSIKQYNPSARAVDVASGYSVADTAIAIGNPEGEGLSVTRGIVSVDSEYFEMATVDKSTNVKWRVMRIDTAVNGGNSGGGLFNNKGELIGIVNAKVNYSSNELPMDNFAYALPYNIVTKVVDNIMFYHFAGVSAASPRKFVVGVVLSVQNAKSVYENGEFKLTEDVVVNQVSEDSFASKIGLQAGDKITTLYINDTAYSITRQFELKDLMYVIRTNDTIKFTVKRNNLDVTTNALVADNTNFVEVV